MAVTTMAVVGTAVAAYGAKKQSDAAKQGAQAGADASAASIAEQQRQFDLSRGDMMPFRDAGVGALARQEAVLGGDYSGFESSPDYLYARGEMTTGLDRSAASQGRLYSGGYGVDMAGALNGLASQNLNNYWSKLAGQAGQGFGAATNLGALGQNFANQYSQNQWGAANARATGYQQSANAWSNFANQAGQFGAWWLGNREKAGG